MTKIRTRLLSAVIAVAVALTMAAAAALSVSAAEKHYVLGTKVADTTGGVSDFVGYTFTLTKQESVVLHWKSLNWRSESGDVALDIQGIEAGSHSSVSSREAPVKVDVVKAYQAAYSPSRGTEVHSGGADAEVNLTYSLKPGKYMVCTNTYEKGINFEFSVSAAGTSATAPVTPVPATTVPATPQPFKPGVVAQNVTAVKSNNTISVKWGAVASARYAVYYIARDKATGVFSDWTVKAVDTAEYHIPNFASGKTYYITILPYTDIPSRQYGGFSPYAHIVT